MPKVAVVGGGIAGLLLALGLKTKLGITAAVYEQAPAFAVKPILLTSFLRPLRDLDEEVGGAIGLYANGQRVIRDISPKLHAEIRAAGVPFVYRRWLRHDGSEVAVGRERCLLDASVAEDEAAELSSLGIRRWRLQKALRQAADDARIPLVFGKRVEKVEDLAAGPAEPYTKGAVLHLSDGTSVTVDLVFGCDVGTYESAELDRDPVRINGAQSPMQKHAWTKPRTSPDRASGLPYGLRFSGKTIRRTRASRV
ncbi:MAG: hypothetical protein BJ554DRAFT_3494 [Olpidium bornovanus]|uniref:FAD-binding domain-containing protein n=1 Tax=Olpidium bornovanus TaxID=278681 RepID=A0A8H7ZP13_9FUNG|nr:MAG: hypothetical protein BJ554DRAFT_3494 [Olpidium bornovanus]